MHGSTFYGVSWGLVFGLACLALLFLGAGLGFAFAKGWRTYGLFGFGLLLVGLFFMAAYLSAPPDFQHDPNGCSDCGDYWGRWWEPGYVAWTAALGYLSYGAGIGVGAGIRALTQGRGQSRQTGSVSG